VTKRERLLSRTRSKSKSMTSAPASRLTLFGEPLLLEGEDAAAYDQLLARICAAVKPVDVIDEMLIVDMVSLEWEVLRWRRLKSSLIRTCGLEALEGFLAEHLARRTSSCKSTRGANQTPSPWSRSFSPPPA
jgi:hypothetical protein